MKRRQFLTASLLASLLSACGRSGATDQEATQRFLTERNGGTPVALGLPADAPIIGTITAIDSQTLTLKPPFGDTTTTIELDANTKISKDSAIQLGALKAGDQVTAFGARNDATFQANVVRLGGDGGAPMIMNWGAPGGPSDQTGSGQVEIGGSGQPANGGDTFIQKADAETTLSGTIDRIDGSRIIIKSNAGSPTTIETSGATRFLQQAAITAADLHTGDLISATGQPSGAAFKATQIQLLPSPQQQ